MVRHALILLAACSSSPSQTQPTTPVAATPPPIDAATAPPIDAADTELLAAPPSVFRFHTTGKAPRLETWTLRHVGDRAQIVVDRMNPAPDAGWTQGGSTIYLGTASDDGATLALALTAGPNKLALACKRDKLAVAGPKAVRKPSKKKPKGCDPGRWDPDKTRSLDVLSCKHPDFDAPMPFAAAPGVEYVFVDEGCALQGGDYRELAEGGAIAPVR